MQNLTNIAFFFSLLLRRFSSFDTSIKNFTFSQKKFTIPFLTNTRTISQKLNKIHTKIQKRPPIF